MKPENILYDEFTNTFQLIDFGSSIYQFEKKTNFYIQSRYYGGRSFIYTDFNEKIDIWSFGCLVYELLFMRPLFLCKNEAGINL